MCWFFIIDIWGGVNCLWYKYPLIMLCVIFVQVYLTIIDKTDTSTTSSQNLRMQSLSSSDAERKNCKSHHFLKIENTFQKLMYIIPELYVFVTFYVVTVIFYILNSPSGCYNLQYGIMQTYTCHYQAQICFTDITHITWPLYYYPKAKT